jgi:hypothetical protein
MWEAPKRPYDLQMEPKVKKTLFFSIYIRFDYNQKKKHVAGICRVICHVKIIHSSTSKRYNQSQAYTITNAIAPTPYPPYPPEATWFPLLHQFLYWCHPHVGVEGGA